MRQLELSGRADGQGRPLRAHRPTDRSTAPSPSEARHPEMRAWTAPDLARFLRWADAQDPDLAMGWRLLAATGMRRGEALALRRRDVDLDAGRLAVRRSVGVVKAKGAGEQLVEGPTKTSQSRVVDLDSGTVAALRAYRAARGLLALDLVRDSALVLSNLDGTHRHPERFSRRFVGQVLQARRALGEHLPVIRLHDLRHTRATLLLADGVPVKVVSECLGHASATITLTVYQHVHPGMGRQAADRFAALLEG
jgi:integrase